MKPFASKACSENCITLARMQTVWAFKNPNKLIQRLKHSDDFMLNCETK